MDLALRGRAGQPAPQAENRERGEMESRWNTATDCQPVPTAENSKSRKSQLALAIAQGKSISVWARKNDVPDRTAYRWATEPKVRAKIKSYHRRVLGRAIGRLATRVTWAADGIVKLAEDANSESVKLSALRSIFSNMMAVSTFAGLEDRVAELEEQLNERTGSTGCPG